MGYIGFIIRHYEVSLGYTLGPLGLNFLFFRQKESLTKKNTTQGGGPLENPPGGGGALFGDRGLLEGQES